MRIPQRWRARNIIANTIESLSSQLCTKCFVCISLNVCVTLQILWGGRYYWGPERLSLLSIYSKWWNQDSNQPEPCARSLHDIASQHNRRSCVLNILKLSGFRESSHFALKHMKLCISVLTDVLQRNRTNRMCMTINL